MWFPEQYIHTFLNTTHNMGHLSEFPGSNGEAKLLKRTNTVNSELEVSNCAVESDKSATKCNGSNGMANGKSLATPPKQKLYFDPVNKVDLENYTKTFKGDKVLGFSFDAPLKWHNIFAIFMVHAAFVVCACTYPVEKANIYTIIWGK